MRDLAEFGDLGPVLARTDQVRVHRVGPVGIELCDAVDPSALNELIRWRAELPQPQREALDRCAGWPYDGVTNNGRVVGALIVPIPAAIGGDARTLDQLRSLDLDGPQVAQLGTLLAWLTGTLDDARISHPGLGPRTVLWSSASQSPFLIGCTTAVPRAATANTTTHLVALAAHLGATNSADPAAALLQQPDDASPAAWYQAFAQPRTADPTSLPAQEPVAQSQTDTDKGHPGTRAGLLVFAALMLVVIAVSAVVLTRGDGGSPDAAIPGQSSNDDTVDLPDNPDASPPTVTAVVTPEDEGGGDDSAADDHDQDAPDGVGDDTVDDADDAGDGMVDDAVPVEREAVALPVGNPSTCEVRVGGGGLLSEIDEFATGFDSALARELVDRVYGDVEICFVPLTAASRFVAVQSGDVDFVVRNTTTTTSREELADFTSPYFLDGLSVAARRSVDGFDDLAGLTVGAVVSFASFPDLVEAFDGGQIDAVATDWIVLQQSFSRPGVEISYLGGLLEPYGVFVADGNTSVRDALDEALRDVVASGAWAEIFAAEIGGEPWFDINEVLELPPVDR